MIFASFSADKLMIDTRYFLMKQVEYCIYKPLFASCERPSVAGLADNVILDDIKGTAEDIPRLAQFAIEKHNAYNVGSFLFLRSFMLTWNKFTLSHSSLIIAIAVVIIIVIIILFV